MLNNTSALLHLAWSESGVWRENFSKSDTSRCLQMLTVVTERAVEFMKYV